MPLFSGKYQSPHRGNVYLLQRNAAGLQRRACCAHVIHEQNPLPLQVCLGALESSADIVSSPASTETYLRNSASHADQGIPSERQAKALRHLFGEKGRLVVSSSLHSPGVKRYWNDDLYGQSILQLVVSQQLTQVHRERPHV